MRYYSVRDMLGHFVKPRNMAGEMCPHACCRGKRPHPKDFPVILSRRMLRDMTDDELIQHFGLHEQNERARQQIFTELDKRDERKARRKAAASARRAAIEERKREQWIVVEHEVMKAEEETRGNMLNSAGIRKNIDPVTLFTGSEERAFRYASEDLIRYWENHPRPNRLYFSDSPSYRRKMAGRSNIGRAEARSGYRSSGYF